MSYGLHRAYQHLAGWSVNVTARGGLFVAVAFCMELDQTGKPANGAVLSQCRHEKGITATNGGLPSCPPAVCLQRSIIMDER